MAHKPTHPHPGDIISPPGNAGIYVRRDDDTVTLNAWAGGTQYRFALDPSQAAALANQLAAETDGTVIVHTAADVFLAQFDAAHNQE
jgi:hypothetical protein